MKADVDGERWCATARYAKGIVRPVCSWGVGVQMFRVQGGGSTFVDLTPREAAAKARALRRSGLNDVEIFRPDNTRISQYGLDQLVRSEAEPAILSRRS